MPQTWMTSTIVWSVFLLTWTLPGVLGHPQCLDYRAPFKPADPLTFCSQYSDTGCCGQTNDDELSKEYQYIKSKADPTVWSQCREYVKQILCQKCSPYAAHIYDAEGTSKPRTFPGLCRGYCEKFYDKCSSLVWFLDPALGFENLLTSRQAFCNKVSLNDKDYCYPDLLGNPLLNGNLSRQETAAFTTGSDGCLCLEKIKSAFANPLWARHAGDGSGRLFVAEQKGRVTIYNTNTKQWLAQSFLDLSGNLALSRFPGDERGFLGMAFHPSYATNGRFFVFYSTPRQAGEALPPELEGKPGTFDFKTRVSEFKVMANDPNRADMGSEKVIGELPQPFFNHNGGEIFFGVDGYLYISLGDGGAAGDVLNAAQDKSLVFGKILRLDVDSDPTKPYTVPPDNPFVNEEGARPEIYAYGVRNTWRCGMDRGDPITGANRGRVLCGDVGQNAYEEVNLLQKGANYGWKAKEGFECYDSGQCATIVGDTEPITAYGHDEGKSVTGGVFYRGCENPGLNGQYIYGDYVTSKLYSLSESGGTWTNREVSLCGGLCEGGLEGYLSHAILSFGEDEQGEIYVLTSKTSSSEACDGTLFKVIDPAMRTDPASCGDDSTSTTRLRMPTRRTAVGVKKDRGPRRQRLKKRKNKRGRKERRRRRQRNGRRRRRGPRGRKGRRRRGKKTSRTKTGKRERSENSRKRSRGRRHHRRNRRPRRQHSSRRRSDIDRPKPTL